MFVLTETRHAWAFERVGSKVAITHPGGGRELVSKGLARRTWADLVRRGARRDFATEAAVTDWHRRNLAT